MVRQENEVPQEKFLKSPLQLSGQQRALYEALSKKEERLASMYLGSLLVLSQAENLTRQPLPQKIEQLRIEEIVVTTTFKVFLITLRYPCQKIFRCG